MIASQSHVTRPLSCFVVVRTTLNEILCRYLFRWYGVLSSVTHSWQWNESNERFSKGLMNNMQRIVSIVFILGYFMSLCWLSMRIHRMWSSTRINIERGHCCFSTTYRHWKCSISRRRNSRVDHIRYTIDCFPLGCLASEKSTCARWTHQFVTWNYNVLFSFCACLIVYNEIFISSRRCWLVEINDIDSIRMKAIETQRKRTSMSDA
jgi:hypothetical protein